VLRYVGTLRQGLAWLLATAPDAALRDGARARALAQEASRLTGGHPVVLGTLAAAQAERGDFAAAAATAAQAAERAAAQGHAALAESLRGQRALYEQGRAFRDRDCCMTIAAAHALAVQPRPAPLVLLLVLALLSI